MWQTHFLPMRSHFESLVLQERKKERLTEKLNFGGRKFTNFNLCVQTVQRKREPIKEVKDVEIFQNISAGFAN